MANPLLYRIVLVGSLGVGYFSYRKLLQMTLINQNMLLNEKQSQELQSRNYTNGINNTIIQGHSVNQVKYNNNNDTIVIVGAGIIGISQSLKLLKEGYNVVLIDRESTAATQTSYYNGCIFTPLSPKTLINPPTFWLLIQNMFKPPEETNLRVNWHIIFEKYFLIFGINALALAGTSAKALRNAEHQVELGRVTLDEVEKLKNTGIFDNQLKLKGQIGLYQNKQVKDDFISLLNHHKIEYKAQVDQQQDPILDKYRQTFPEEMQFITDNAIETRDISLAMLNYCQTQFKNNFTFLPNTNVKSFVLNHKSEAIGVLSNNGIILGNQFIVCGAHWSKYLLNKLGIRVPLMPAKGWAIGFNIDKEHQNSVLTQYNIYTPNYLSTYVNNQVRLSACAEIGNDTSSENPRMDWGAIYALNKFNEHSGLNIQMQDCQVRSCYRPITADDLPIMSVSPYFNNVYINTGHGSKGMSYCFGSAEIIHQLLNKSKQYPQFSVMRFYLV